MSDHITYRAAAVSKTQNESSVSDLFNTFLSMNPKTGAVVFEVHNDSPVRGRIPIPNAKITISKLLGNDYYLSKIITTNDNGETDPIELPTVSRDLSQKPGESRVFSTYRASVEAPGYNRQDIYDIQIFDGITSVQHINLQQSAANRGVQPGPTAPATPTKPTTPTSPTAPAAPTTPTSPTAPAAPARPTVPTRPTGYYME